MNHAAQQGLLWQVDGEALDEGLLRRLGAAECIAKDALSLAGDRGAAGVPAQSSLPQLRLAEWKHRPPSRVMAMVCRDSKFWQYLEFVDPAALPGEIDEVHARRYIQRVCEVETRRMLDHDRMLAARFDGLVIRPFLAWLAFHDGSGSPPIAAQP